MSSIFETKKQLAVLTKKNKANFCFEIGKDKTEMTIPTPFFKVHYGYHRSPSIGEKFLLTTTFETLDA